MLCLISVAGCASPGLTVDSEPPKTERQLEAESYCSQRRDGGFLPPYRFITDGCTLWPEGSWGECCIAHDMAYWCGGSGDERAAADRELAACVAAIGNAGMGRLMQFGTRLGGVSWLPVPWRWGYGWRWPESGKVAVD